VKKYNPYASDKMIASMTGRVIKHPTTIRAHSVPGASNIGKRNLEYIAIDIESDYNTGETKLIGCFDGEKYWYYEDSFLENLRALVRYCERHDKSIAYWSHFDPLQVFRILLTSIPEMERDACVKAYEKIGGVWNRKGKKWSIPPIIKTFIGGNELGVTMSVRGNLQLYTRNEQSDTIGKVWMYNIAPFYAEDLKKTAARFMPWYSKLETKDHLVTGSEWDEVRKPGPRRDGVLASNELDAKAAYFLARKVGEDFASVFWGYYPKNLISVGALGRAAIAAYANHTHDELPPKAKKAVVADELKSFAIHSHLGAWRKQLGDDTFKDFYAAVHEVYKGAKIECYGYGYWKKAYTADLTQAYPATERELLDMRESVVDVGFGNPPAENATDWVLIRGTIHVPDKCEYHPFLIRKPCDEDSNICPTGTFTTTYWKDERDIGLAMGIRFDDEIWYRIHTTGRLSLFAGAVDAQVKERTRLKKLKDPNELRLKQAASSDYGIRFEATPMYKMEKVERHVEIDAANDVNPWRDLLATYRHKIDLTVVEKDLRAYYDTEWPKVRAMWHGEGKTPDVIALELESMGLYMEETNASDIMIRLNELYRAADRVSRTETVTENEIRFDGLRAGDYFDPIAASRITMKTRVMITRACLNIVKNGGRPIFAQTDAIEWEGRAEDLDPEYWHEEKTVGFFEKPSEIRDLVSLGAGRYEYLKLDPDTGEWNQLTAKSRGVYIDHLHGEEGIPLTDMKWRDALKNLVDGKIVLTTKILVTPGLTSIAKSYHAMEYKDEDHPEKGGKIVKRPLYKEDIGRIITVVKTLDPISGRKKRYIELPKDLTTLAKKHYWSLPVAVCGGVAPGEGDIDDTLPEMREELKHVQCEPEPDTKRENNMEHAERREKYFLLRRHKFNPDEATKFSGRSWPNVMEMIKARDTI